tara:strand:- start:89 stop:871 length:783 start_codon:yes stop_codon:yes gene_type:complete
MKVVLVTGGFDPIHSGHLAYFKAAKQLGDKLVVGLNSDNWLTNKKGKPFMPFQERIEIIRGLSIVDEVISFDDSDGSASGAIYKLMATSAHNHDIIFANGGDRTEGNIPEMKTWYDKIEFVFGVGGEDKKNSSSWILKEWKAPKVEREWGHYRELYQGEGFQVKELVIAPHSSLSMQRHKNRSETWNLVSGNAHIKMSHSSTNPFDGCRVHYLHPANPVDIPNNIWHQGCNDDDEPAHIVEVWKGETSKLREDDIERWDP